jgi:hypothetical protein
MVHLRMLNAKFTPDSSTPEGHRVCYLYPFVWVCEDFVAVNKPVQFVRGVGVTGRFTQKDQLLVFIYVGVACDMNSWGKNEIFTMLT